MIRAKERVKSIVNFIAGFIGYSLLGRLGRWVCWVVGSIESVGSVGPVKCAALSCGISRAKGLLGHWVVGSVGSV